MAEYIKREALMKNFCGYDLTKCVKYGNKDADQQHDSYSTMMMYEIADEIIDAPAADVVPRHKLQEEVDREVSDLTSALEAERRKVYRLEKELRKAESERDYMRSRMEFFREVAEHS